MCCGALSWLWVMLAATAPVLGKCNTNRLLDTFRPLTTHQSQRRLGVSKAEQSCVVDGTAPGARMVDWAVDSPADLLGYMKSTGYGDRGQYSHGDGTCTLYAATCPPGHVNQNYALKKEQQCAPCPVGRWVRLPSFFLPSRPLPSWSMGVCERLFPHCLQVKIDCHIMPKGWQLCGLHPSILLMPGWRQDDLMVQAPIVDV